MERLDGLLRDEMEEQGGGEAFPKRLRTGPADDRDVAGRGTPTETRVEPDSDGGEAVGAKREHDLLAARAMHRKASQL